MYLDDCLALYESCLFAGGVQRSDRGYPDAGGVIGAAAEARTAGVSVLRARRAGLGRAEPHR